MVTAHFRRRLTNSRPVGEYMNPPELFSIINVLHVLLPCFLALLVMCSRWPHGKVLRSVGAVLLAWIADVAFTMCIYNPIGIAAATYQGIDSPGMRFDNNTVAVALLAGWCYPALTIAAIYVFKALKTRARART